MKQNQILKYTTLVDEYKHNNDMLNIQYAKYMRNIQRNYDMKKNLKSKCF